MAYVYPAAQPMTHWPLRRVVVHGQSMRPALEAGDRLLVAGFLRPRSGDVVAVVDPRDRTRVMVKRVASVDPDDGRVTVVGDNPAASTDSRTFGPVDAGLVLGRVIYRYWPDERRGRLKG